MAATTMHFGPEWMRTKHQPLSRPQQPPSPPPTSTPSTYSALVSSIPPATENDKQNDVHPFRYSKDELLRIYKDSPKGGLGLEVDRYEGVVREIGGDPVALREMGDAEKKLFSGPLNSDLRRRQSTDLLSPLNTSSLATDRPRLNHASNSATASPLRDRFKRRDSNADSPTVQRKVSLSSLQSPSLASRTAALPSPRNRGSGYTSFDGVLSSGDTWSARRRASEALKPGAVARESTGDTEDKAEGQLGAGVNGIGDSARHSQDGKGTNHATPASAAVASGQHNAETPNAGNTAMAPQDLAAVDWSYKDPSGNIQGPFNAGVMQKWFDDGYFTMDLPMKRTHLDTTWMTLEELIKRATNPDKMFLSPLATSGPPGLSRRIDSPLQGGLPQNDQNVFSNPYQPSPIRTLRSTTLDSLNGTNVSNSPVSAIGHLGTDSPDPSLAFTNRLNGPVYNGDPFTGGMHDLGLRQRQVTDLAHDSPHRLHSPSYNALMGGHHLGYEGYGYPGFTPVQSSPWGTPSQPYSNYNHNVGFGNNGYGTPYGMQHHNQQLGGQVSANAHYQEMINQQQQQLHNAQNYFDPAPLINGLLNEPNSAPPASQNEQYQQISPVEAQRDPVAQTQPNAAASAAPVWDDAPVESTRRANPFDHPNTLNTSVPAASSQSSPWGAVVEPTAAQPQTPPLPERAWGALAADPTAWPRYNEPAPTVTEVTTAVESLQLQPIPEAPADVAVESTPASIPAAAAKAKTKKAAAPSPIVVAEAPAAEVSSESPPPSAQPTKAPWAKTDKKKGKLPTAVSLRDIQDAEAKLAEARKAEKEKARQAAAAAAAALVGSQEDIQPFTASWGLPTSQAGSRSAGLVKEGSSASPSPATSTPPVWSTTAAKAPAAKKTMKEIQEEEERRKKAALKEPVPVAAAAKRGYAEQTGKTTPAAPVAPAMGSAWVTVGASGKTATPIVAAPRPAATVIPSAPLNHAASSKLAATPARSVASVVRPASAHKTEDFPVTPSHDFLKWLSESLKGLNNSVNVEEIISMLLSFPLDPDQLTLEIISETIYANSTTLDGRRFAAEFVAKRKSDAASRKGGNAAKGGNKAISIAEIVKTTPKPSAQSEWGFKVVNKKKKGNRA